MGGRHGVAVYAALVTVTVSTTTFLFFVNSFTPTERALLILVSLAAWVALVRLGARGGLPITPIVVAIAIVIGAGLATPTKQSNDIFAYTMYGRIAVEHH